MKTGYIVRDINKDRTGLLVDIVSSDTGRGTMGYIVLVDNKQI